MLGLFWLLVGNAAVLLGAHAVLRRIKTGDGPTDAVLFLLLRLLIISIGMIVAGICGGMTATVLGVSAAVLLAALLAAGEHTRIAPWRGPQVGLLSGLMAGVVLARLLGQVWFFAPYAGDALSYHLPKVGEWVQAGGFTREMGLDTHVTFPAGFELIEAWWVVFLHHDVLIEMAGVEFLILAGTATYALARRMGLDEAPAFGSALLLSLTPVLQVQATACVNDAPAIALILATFALILGPVPYPLLILAGGLGTGVKPIFVYALPGMLLLLYFTRRAERPRGPGFRISQAVGLCGLLAGAFWYLRNAVWFGNPVYPVGSRGLSGPHPVQYGASLSSLLGNLTDLVSVRIFDAASPYGPFTGDIAGWGGIAVACGSAALVLALREDSRYRRLSLCFAVSLVSVLGLVLHDPWCMRFVAFFPAVLALAVGRLLGTSRWVGALVAAAALHQAVATSFPQDIPWSRARELAGLSWKERSAAPLRGLEIPADVVGYFVDNRNCAYLLYRPDFSRRVLYLRARSADELLTVLDRESVPVVYASSSSPDHAAIVRECERRGRLRKLGGNLYAREPVRPPGG